jgi:cytochrome c oxidase subunit 4
LPRREILVLLAVYVALLLLLTATVAVSFFKLGAWNAVLNLGIAGAKAALIAWFFMELRRATPMVRLAAVAGLFWLVLLFGLSFTDFLTRGHFGL